MFIVAFIEKKTIRVSRWRPEKIVPYSVLKFQFDHAYFPGRLMRPHILVRKWIKKKEK